LYVFVFRTFFLFLEFFLFLVLGGGTVDTYEDV
jgi:hypothetical protein